MTTIDKLSFNISSALKQKFPEIDAQHYSPNVIKDFIIRTNSNFQSNEGVQKIIIGLTNNLNQFKLKINKNRQAQGLVDFSFNPATSQSKSAPIPQQNLVKQTPVFNAPANTSRREYINQSPLIIDPSMANQLNNQQVYLNQIETNNHQTVNYQSFPSAPMTQNNSSNNRNENNDNNVINVNLGTPIDNILNNLPTTLPTETSTSMPASNPSSLSQNNNFTDRFILTEKQRSLIKEDGSDISYYIIIDSKDRDMNAFRSPNDYTIRFSPPNFNGTDNRNGFVDKIFHNVKSLELVRCGFLDTSGITGASDHQENDPPYVILEIDEFITQHNGTNQNLNRATIIMDSFSKIGKYKYYDLYDNEGRVTKFNPRVTIDKMSVKFRLPDGSLYKFGEENDDNTKTVNYMIFRIVVMHKMLDTNYLNKTS
jgi:hypothetical protein